MDRRGLLKAAAAGSLAALAAPAATLATARGAARRARAGDPAWPSPAAWERLRRQVGGRLIEPRPLFADCQAAPKGQECRDTLKYLGDPYYIGDQPGGTQVSGWLDAWSPAASAYAVAARDASDVTAAVDFARTHNLRLAV